MAHAWKACWVQALGGSNPPSSATGPRDLLRFRGFCCLWRRLCCLWCRWCSGRRRARPLCVPLGGGPPASRPRRELRSARRLEARPGPAAAHRHRGRSLQTSGALRTGGACVAVCTGRQSGGPELLSPGLVPLDSETFDDLCARERSQDLARHKELRSAQARADAAPSDRARRVDEEPP